MLASSLSFIHLFTLSRPPKILLSLSPFLFLSLSLSLSLSVPSLSLFSVYFYVRRSYALAHAVWKRRQTDKKRKVKTIKRKHIERQKLRKVLKRE